MPKVIAGVGRRRTPESSKFIFTIDTTKPGSSNNMFFLNANDLGTYNATIEWGDGTTSKVHSFISLGLRHEYDTPGIYTVKVSGSLPYPKFSGDDKLKLMSINQWGDNQWLNMATTFMDCSNLEIYATDTPNTSSVTSMGEAFWGCTSLTNVDFSGWDLSNVIYFSSTFNSCTSLQSVNFTNAILNTSSNVLTMSYTFYNCGEFDLIGFDTLDLTKVSTYEGFLNSSKIPTNRYDSLLTHLDGLNVVSDLLVDFGTSQYTLGSTAETSRTSLTTNDLWTITDGGGI